MKIMSLLLLGVLIALPAGYAADAQRAGTTSSTYNEPMVPETTLENSGGKAEQGAAFSIYTPGSEGMGGVGGSAYGHDKTFTPGYTGSEEEMKAMQEKMKEQMDRLIEQMREQMEKMQEQMASMKEQMERQMQQMNDQMQRMKEDMERDRNQFDSNSRGNSFGHPW